MRTPLNAPIASCANILPPLTLITCRARNRLYPHALPSLCRDAGPPPSSSPRTCTPSQHLQPHCLLPDKSLPSTPQLPHPPHTPIPSLSLSLPPSPTGQAPQHPAAAEAGRPTDCCGALSLPSPSLFRCVPFSQLSTHVQIKPGSSLSPIPPSILAALHPPTHLTHPLPLSLLPSLPFTQEKYQHVLLQHNLDGLLTAAGPSPRPPSLFPFVPPSSTHMCRPSQHLHPHPFLPVSSCAPPPPNTHTGKAPARAAAGEA